MAKDVMNIALRVSFQVRRDGLYRLINHGRWSRIACRSKTLELRFQHGNILIEEARPPKEKASGSQPPRRNRRAATSKSADRGKKRNSKEAVSQAVGEVLKKLVDLEGIVEIRRSRRFVRPVANLDQATGFLIKVPGIGPTLAIKPAGLRNWLHGAVPFRRVLAELDDKGQLIRGADGKTTRQVVVPGVGRGRYYCFKTTKTRVPARDQPSKPSRRQEVKPSPPPAVVPTPPSVLASDDDWGWGTRTVSEDQVAAGRRLGLSNRVASSGARGRRARDMGSVTTRRADRRP